jgi:toxin FitB
LLDTCAISEATKPRPSTAVMSWFAEQDELSLYVSVLTLGELERGIARLDSSARPQQLRKWFERLRRAFQGRVLPVDEPTALEWGRLTAAAEREGKVLPVVDALLGATAIVHGIAVVTRNVSDIARTGAAIVDPWAA